MGAGDSWVELELYEGQAWCWDWMKCRPGVDCRGGVGWTWSGFNGGAGDGVMWVS